MLRKDQSPAVEYADVRLLQLARVDQHDADVNTLNERNLNDFGKYLFSGNGAILPDTQQPSTLHFFVSSSYAALAVGVDPNYLVRCARRQRGVEIWQSRRWADECNWRIPLNTG